MARPSLLAGLPRFHRGGFWLFVIAASVSALLADHPLAGQLLLDTHFAVDLALWQPLTAIALFPEGQLAGLVGTLLLQWFIGGHLEAQWGTARYLTFVLLPAFAGYLGKTLGSSVLGNNLGALLGAFVLGMLTKLYARLL